MKRNTVEKVRIVKNRKEYKRKGNGSIEQKGIRQKRLKQYRIERNIKKVRIVQNGKEYGRKGQNSKEKKGI